MCALGVVLATDRLPSDLPPGPQEFWVRPVKAAGRCLMQGSPFPPPPATPPPAFLSELLGITICSKELRAVGRRFGSCVRPGDPCSSGPAGGFCGAWMLLFLSYCLNSPDQLGTSRLLGICGGSSWEEGTASALGVSFHSGHHWLSQEFVSQRAKVDSEALAGW